VEVDETYSEGELDEDVKNTFQMCGEGLAYEHEMAAGIFGDEDDED
jgi:hypothetical protein